MATTTRKKKSPDAKAPRRKGARSGSAAGTKGAPNLDVERAKNFKEGDAVRIVGTPTHEGETTGVLEIDLTDGTIRTEFGWFPAHQLVAHKQKISTSVDGKDADVVLDGKTGGVKSPENGAPQQSKLLELSTEQLIHEMALKTVERNGLASQAGRLRNAVKEADKIIDGFVAELIERDAKEHNLQLQLSTTGDEPEDEDEEDDDDEEIEQRRTVNVGARTYESGEGPE